MAKTNQETPSRSPLKSLFTGLIPLFVLAHFGHHLLTALPTPLLPMIREHFQLDYTRSGFVLSAFSLAYGFSQIPAGWITDRVGARIIITIGISGVAAAGALVGLSTTYAMLLFAMGLMGIMAGGYHPAAPPIIAASVDKNKMGKALGLHMIGGSSSYFLAPLIAAGLATIWGWKGAFLGLSVLAMAFGIFFYMRLESVVPRKAPGAAINKPEEPAVPGRTRRLVLFIILSTFTQVIIHSIFAFVPLMLVDRIGFAKEAAAAFIALYYASGLWAGPLGGYISDRLGALPMVITVCFAAAPIIFLLGQASHAVAVGALLVLLGVVIYVRMPLSEVYLVSNTPAHRRSAVLGIYYFSSMEGSGVLVPVMGYMIDQFGFNLSFTVGAIAILLVTIPCAIGLRQSTSRTKISAA